MKKKVYISPSSIEAHVDAGYVLYDLNMPGSHSDIPEVSNGEVGSKRRGCFYDDCDVNSDDDSFWSQEY